MAQNIEAVTTAALSLALDAASLRHQAIAANVANHATEGFVAQKVDFGTQMRMAMRSVEGTGTLDAESLSRVQVRIEPALDASGQPVKVQLDAQMADIAQNTVHYQALVRALSRHFAVLHSAASDGKR